MENVMKRTIIVFEEIGAGHPFEGYNVHSSLLEKSSKYLKTFFFDRPILCSKIIMCHIRKIQKYI